MQVCQSLCYVTSLSLLSLIQYMLTASLCCNSAPQKREIFGNICVDTILLIQQPFFLFLFVFYMFLTYLQLMSRVTSRTLSYCQTALSLCLFSQQCSSCPVLFLNMTITTSTMYNVSNTVFITTANSSCDKQHCCPMSHPPTPHHDCIRVVIFLSKAEGLSFRLCFSSSIVQQHLSHIQTSLQGVIGVQSSR